MRGVGKENGSAKFWSVNTEVFTTVRVNVNLSFKNTGDIGDSILLTSLQNLSDPISQRSEPNQQ